MIDEIARYLTDGYWEAEGNKRHKFDVKSGGTLKVDITSLTEDGQQLARWALDAWTNVSGIEFEFVENNADITFDDNEDEAITSTTVKGGVIVFSEVNIPASWPIEKGNTIDSFTFFTYIHEIGHALGLGHPGPYNSATEANRADDLFLHDSWQFSVMSYFSQSTNTNIDASDAYPITPMIADIVAIQNLYGTPEDINAGDTVYGYESNIEGYMSHFFEQWNNYNGQLDLPHLQSQGEDADAPVGDNPFISRSSHPFSHIMGSSVRLEEGSPAFADLDDDGDLDLILGAGNVIEYFENTGTATNPRFVEWDELGSLEVGEDSEPTLADLDNDGDFDIAVGNDNGRIDYFENTGTSDNPTFVKQIGPDNPFDNVDVGSDSTPEFVDLDGDGDFDVVSGDSFGFLEYIENTGTKNMPQFTLRTGVDNPFNNIEFSFQSSPAFADTDGDGDFDLLVGSIGGISDRLDYFENLGTATSPEFIDSPVYSISSSLPKPVFADIDGDGDPDLIVGGSRFASLDYFEHTGTRSNPIPDEVSGANKSVALTLYDTNGRDTLDLRTDTFNQRVDLRPEGISDVYGLTGNLIIARDTLIENYVAGTGDDTITGNDIDNVIEGGAGADTIDGGAGIDTASYAGSASRVDVRLSGTVVNHGDATGDSLTNIENLLGSAHNDTLAGDVAANALTGLAGNDLLWGSSGDDVLTGGPGADRLVGGAGNDTASFAGSPEGVTVRLHGLSAANGDAQGDSFPYTVDVAYADADGLEQTETLPDVEHLIGSSHNDILAGDRRDNVIDGGAGDDTLYGGPGGGDDEMTGGTGNDRLFGGQGADTLDGGPGDDTLAGGPGTDVFVFDPGDGVDTVTDFSAGTDKLNLTAFDIDSVNDITMTTGDDGVTIDLSDIGGGSILLADLTDIPDAGDFLV